MAADMQIHVLTDEFTEEHFRAFQSNTLGSKWFRIGYNQQFERERGCDLFRLCADTPSVHVGEVSWLKAAVFEDEGTFIPDAVARVQEIVHDDCPVIDAALISAVEDAFRLPNNSAGYAVSSAEEVLTFLRLHEGERAFTISW